MTPEVFTAGGAIIDNVVEADGTVHLDQIGGNALYSAAGARLVADAVGVVARVPADYPDLAELAAGLDLGGIGRVAGETAVPEWFFYEPDGSRIDRLYADAAELARFGLGDRQLAPDEVRRWRAYLAERPTDHGFGAFRARHPVRPEHVPEAYWSARGVHLGPNAVDAQIALARAARARGLVVSLDPGFHARAIAETDLRVLLELVDAFLPSEQELAALRPGLAPEAALRSLAEHGGAVIGVKRGARGSLVLDPGEGRVVAIPALAVAARDPTGAGDSFCGAFLASLAQGLAPPEAACRGTAAASFAVEGPGALRLLRVPRAEALARRDRVRDAIG